MNPTLLRGLVAAACLGAAFPAPLLAWSPKQAPIETRWAKDVDPNNVLPDYPRPQMVRSRWLNLNGVWEFKRGAADDALPASDAKLPEEILVPFPMESALSGIMAHSERVWYRRHFTVPKEWADQRVLLHFGAVDWESEVFVNGKSVGVHKGGYLPFQYDVTPFLHGDGPQELVVRVYDPTDDAGEPRGKQSLHGTGGLMYTCTTGIWQTVWLEPVAEAGIENLRLIPDVDGGFLNLNVEVRSIPTGGERRITFEPELTVQTKIKDGDRIISAQEGRSTEKLKIPVPNAKLWTPENPFLYGLEVSVSREGKVIDTVQSYFGMRKIALGEENGVKKMFFNGKPVFQFGPLDQGFWPEGIYTAPTEAAMKNDIETMKAYGFNMVRKHIKVEPARWYYWCDKLGLMVWQDMPSPNSYPGFSKPKEPVDRPEFKAELQGMIRHLWNTPSIILWDVFNEEQGLHDSKALVEMVRQMDPTRLVNENSGTNQGGGDLNDIHPYPAPRCPEPSANQALVIGEFGGIGLRVPGHMWAGEGGGYKDVQNGDDLVDLYGEFAGTLREFRDQRGLSAAVYTQLTDVEKELNGLMTYDRVPKFDPARLVAANRLQYQPPTYRPVLPTSEAEAQTWQYTTDRPAAGWEKLGFDDAAWSTGRAGFGQVPQITGHTPWNTSDIWLRKHFKLGDLSAEELGRLALRLYHDDDVQVFVNGVAAYEHDRWTDRYESHGLNPAVVKALVPGGDNVLAIHCLQKQGGQYIDAGIYERVPAAP